MNTLVTLAKNFVAVITQDKVIDENLKRQTKNRTLCTRRQLLITFFCATSAAFLAMSEVSL